MGNEEIELSERHIERIDEIHNAVYEMCKVIAGNEELEWDMHYIGEIADLAAGMLADRGEKVFYPSITEGDDGKQYIQEYVGEEVQE